MQLDIDVEEPWPAADWEALFHEAAAALAQVAPELANDRLAASVLLTSDAEVHALNREWRQRDKPTNVLSFPMLSREEVGALPLAGPPVLAGDVALAYETCLREAADKGVTLADHAAHLLVHGLLHLSGHDHELSDGDAETMEALETKALAIIGVADPYGDRGAI